MSKIIDSLAEAAGQIADSNLDRIEKWINSKEVAGITAFRKELKDVHNQSATLIDKPIDGTPEERRYSKQENRARNRDLKMALARKGYGVTSVMGLYPEGGVPKTEESFLVVNLPDDPEFYDVLFRLSEWYNQDTFLYKPKDEPEAVLVGTNDDDFVGYGNTRPAGQFAKNVQGEFMSRLKSKGYAFVSEDTKDYYEKDNPVSWKDRKAARTVSDSAIESLFRVIDSSLSGLAVVSEVGKLVKDSRLPNINWKCFIRK